MDRRDVIIRINGKHYATLHQTTTPIEKIQERMRNTIMARDGLIEIIEGPDVPENILMPSWQFHTCKKS